jgi:hypothetical protein
MVSPPDGILRSVGAHTWEGTLHGYRVIISSPSVWQFAIKDGRGHMLLCPRDRSFAEGAQLAREWIERRRPLESPSTPGLKVHR